MATTFSDAYVGDLSGRITGTVPRPQDSGPENVFQPNHNIR